MWKKILTIDSEKNIKTAASTDEKFVAINAYIGKREDLKSMTSAYTKLEKKKSKSNAK